MNRKTEVPALSVVPPEETAAPAADWAIVRLGLVLTIERRSLPLELAFCTSQGEDQSECFFVKPGARSAVCHLCDSRHEVISLIEAVEERELTLAADHDTNNGVIPVIPAQTLLGAMFREIRRAPVPKAAAS
jgi:hypothetical protein